MVGNDWVVRYDNRALQILPTARAKRHTGPKGRILVRETSTGELLLVARTPAGKEQLLEWQPAACATHPPNYHAPARPVLALTPVAPAGFTRAGQPLSARQMAVRARWSQAVTLPIARKDPQTVAPTTSTA